MKKREVRPPYFWKAFVAFFIATFLFVLIFLLAYSVTYFNYQKIYEENQYLKESLEELDLHIAQVECDNEVLFDASRRLDFVGSRIGILENRLGKDDVRVLEQKELYFELELKHFEIINLLNERCEVSFTTVLFFYSNLERDGVDKESERMGYILGTLKNKYPSEVMVYSFDVNLQSGVIDGLLERYSVQGVPIIILNEQDTLYVKNLKDIERVIFE